MAQIFKYTLEPLRTFQKIEMPTFARILSAQEQDGKLVLWAAVAPLMAKQERGILVLPTDVDFHNDLFAKEPDLCEYVWQHVDTVQMSNGLVFHIFC